MYTGEQVDQPAREDEPDVTRQDRQLLKSDLHKFPLPHHHPIMLLILTKLPTSRPNRIQVKNLCPTTQSPIMQLENLCPTT